MCFAAFPQYKKGIMIHVTQIFCIVGLEMVEMPKILARYPFEYPMLEILDQNPSKFFLDIYQVFFNYNHIIIYNIIKMTIVEIVESELFDLKIMII